LSGHFLLTSGLHSDVYFEKFRVLESPDLTKRMLSGIAKEVGTLEPDVIAGPTTGGILVAFALAELLGKEAAYAERAETGRVFRRGFSLEDKRVLIADDVMTTGGSVLDTIEAVKKQGGIPVGVALLVDRSQGVELGLPCFPVLKLPMSAWKASECPLCEKGIPLTIRGKGKA